MTELLCFKINLLFLSLSVVWTALSTNAWYLNAQSSKLLRLYLQLGTDTVTSTGIIATLWSALTVEQTGSMQRICLNQSSSLHTPHHHTHKTAVNLHLLLHWPMWMSSKTLPGESNKKATSVCGPLATQTHTHTHQNFVYSPCLQSVFIHKEESSASASC